jgi:haloalkane dehalogenase
MKRPFTISPELYPFESRWTEIEGIDVHYIDEGTGPAILFCHGNPSWSLVFAPLIMRLREDFRCVAMDLPGFGMSPKVGLPDYGFRPEDHARILGRFVDRILPGDFSVFVQDWGGPIGLDVAGDRAQRLRHLFIGNTFAWPADPDSRIGQGMIAWAEKMGSDDVQGRILDRNFFIKLSLPHLTSGYRRREPHLVDSVKQAYRDSVPNRESRTGIATFPVSVVRSADWLAGVERKLAVMKTKPALLFWGMKDWVYPEFVAERWKSTLTDFKFIPLPSAGHFFQQDEPDLIAGEIRARRKTAASEAKK